MADILFRRLRSGEVATASPERRLSARMALLASVLVALAGCATESREDQRHTQSDTDRSTMSHGQTEGSGGSY